MITAYSLPYYKSLACEFASYILYQGRALVEFTLDCKISYGATLSFENNDLPPQPKQR